LDLHSSTSNKGYHSCSLAIVPTNGFQVTVKKLEHFVSQNALQGKKVILVSFLREIA
jgi:hypothetical protein